MGFQEVPSTVPQGKGQCFALQTFPMGNGHWVGRLAPGLCVNSSSPLTSLDFSLSSCDVGHLEESDSEIYIGTALS